MILRFLDGGQAFASCLVDRGKDRALIAAAAKQVSDPSGFLKSTDWQKLDGLGHSDRNSVAFARHLATVLPFSSRVSEDHAIWNVLAFAALTSGFLNWEEPDEKGDFHTLFMMPSGPWNRRYRHLIWSKWYAFSQHGEHSAFALSNPKRLAHPVSVGGDSLEALLSRQDFAEHYELWRLANGLFIDLSCLPTVKPKGDFTKSGVRPLVRALIQISCNYYTRDLRAEEIYVLLPLSFRQRWPIPVGLP